MKISSMRLINVALVSAVTVSWSMALFVTPASAQAATLYDELGQQGGISKIVDETVTLVLADERIKTSFKDTNIKRFSKLLKEQFCVVAGGPCEYSGDEMMIVHEKLGVTSAHFNALAEDLQLAMEKCNIPFSVQNKFIAKLAPMKRDIVTGK